MKAILSIVIALTLALQLYSQEIPFDADDFILTGDAIQQSGPCFQLTEATFWQGGGIWFRKPIDLRKPFEMEIDVQFGCDDAGADGMVFIFHPELTTGFQGEGMGFGGLYPSFGIEMDTYENYHLADPWYDHVSLVRNGRVNHHSAISPPYPIGPNKENVEDCRKHRVRILWSPVRQMIQFYFDGKMRLMRKVDLVNDIFFSDPIVYWGFTSATGAKVNTHLVCLEELNFTTSNTLPRHIRELLLSGREYILQDADFISGGTSLPKNAHEELDQIIQFLKDNPKHSIFLNGYTDSAGSENSNRQISKKRSESIANYLIQNGIDPTRVISKGYGEANPIAPNDTAEGRRLNRRIEVLVRVLRT